MRFLAATILCLTAFAGSAGATVASAEPRHPYEFVVIYERSGGLAGSIQSLIVAPGWFATATSDGTRAGEQRAEFHLSNRRIHRLQQGLRRAHLGSIEADPAASCADCYLYNLFYEGHNLKLEESEVPPPLQDVLNELDAIITAHTIPPNARSAGV